MCHIIIDANCEVVFRLCFAQFIENGFDHPRGKLLRANTIATADDSWSESNAKGISFVDCFHHIQVEWFTSTAGFLCTIQDSNGFDRLWYRLQEMLNREWAE